MEINQHIETIKEQLVNVHHFEFADDAGMGNHLIQMKVWNIMNLSDNVSEEQALARFHFVIDQGANDLKEYVANNKIQIFWKRPDVPTQIKSEYEYVMKDVVAEAYILFNATDAMYAEVVERETEGKQ